jgi:2-methylisocitrate lyase-like PEP mutase family enzyme
MGLKGATYTVDELAAAGVKRISVGGSFARAALGAFLRAAREVKEHGTFTYADRERKPLKRRKSTFAVDCSAAINGQRVDAGAW